MTLARPGLWLMARIVGLSVKGGFASRATGWMVLLTGAATEAEPKGTGNLGSIQDTVRVKPSVQKT